MTSLLELLDVPPARGRRSKLEAERVREIAPDDLKELLEEPNLEQVSPIQQLRHQHHLLARLIAEGKQLTEASLITGYSVTYISRLKTQDKAFRELITYYRQQVGEVFVNVHERLAGLSLSTLEEIQDRLATSPGSFTNRELFELSELTLDRSGSGPTSTQRNVNVILTSDDVDRLKAEVFRRQRGTIREINPRNLLGGASEGPAMEEAKANGAEGSWGILPTEGGG